MPEEYNLAQVFLFLLKEKMFSEDRTV